ncbi:MAG TPA: hypothetical protein VHE30_03435 [Polyangiaceae bacterium]|nr:hypothetical protein [Polyangiaceae bacterium]
MSASTPKRAADGGGSASPAFELVFRPSVELISVVRRFVAEFYERTLDDLEIASRLALATHELLENAAKYSADGETKLYVRVDRADGSVVVRTENRATTTQIDALREWFSEFEAAGDADTIYAEMIRRTAARKSGSGGLGLARIWSESEMAIDLAVEADRVRIQASGKLSSAG